MVTTAAVNLSRQWKLLQGKLSKVNYDDAGFGTERASVRILTG